MILDTNVAQEVNEKSKAVPDVFTAVQKDPKFMEWFAAAIAKESKK